jgi:DNA-3-methyladenine glycosylase
MILPPSFYQRSTKKVARELLGKRLVRIHKGKRISGIITETEAYLGLIDKGCHSYGGKITERLKTMYLDGGHSYVYFIYGMYYCFNVVTRSPQHPEAVLIRSLEPVEGLDLMKKFRKQDNIKNLTTGPGKLTQALAITKQENGVSLLEDTLFIEDFHSIPKTQIIARPRIGIDYAEEAKDWPLRFYIKDSQFISKK